MIDGVGVVGACRATGLRKPQVRYIADQGHVGEVRRVRGERRFTSAQVAVLQRIVELMTLGFQLPEAAGIAELESAGTGNVDLVHLCAVAQNTAASIERSLRGWLALCAIIGREVGASRPAVVEETR